MNRKIIFGLLSLTVIGGVAFYLYKTKKVTSDKLAAEKKDIKAKIELKVEALKKQRVENPMISTDVTARKGAVYLVETDEKPRA